MKVVDDVRWESLPYGSGDLGTVIPVGSGMAAGISLAAAGDMALSGHNARSHRSRFLRALGIAEDRVFSVHQVHSREVVFIDGRLPKELADVSADGMITDSGEAVLTVTVADCLPIFLADRASGAFGLVHSGWKGTGIVVRAIAAMEAQLGSRPADLVVTIGPGIGPCCYRVAEERAALFAAEFGTEAIARDDAGAPTLDLRRANIDLLLAAGVADIAVVRDCTCCSPALGSFRRQGPKFTRMLAYAARMGPERT